jgi:hypothetical protein
MEDEVLEGAGSSFRIKETEVADNVLPKCNASGAAGRE